MLLMLQDGVWMTLLASVILSGYRGIFDRLNRCYHNCGRAILGVRRT